MASELIQTYLIGDIEVEVTEAKHPSKIHIKATRGTAKMEFDAKRYDFENYYRHMNQKIRQRFDEAGDGDPKPL